jgi:hypothetical protein
LGLAACRLKPLVRLRWMRTGLVINQSFQCFQTVISKSPITKIIDIIVVILTAHKV